MRDYFTSYIEKRPIFLAMLRTAEARLMARAEVPAPALDLGCGDGFFCSLLPESSQFVGLDPDVEALRIAARQGSHSGHVAAEAGFLPFRSNYFATVMSNSVLEHIPELGPALDEVHRVLRPRGRVLLTVPSHWFGEMLMGATILRRLRLSPLSRAYVRWFNRHSRHYHTDAAEVWVNRLRARGFQVVRHHYYFGDASHRAFDIAHYLSVGHLMSFRLTGKWVAFRIPLMADLLDRCFRRYTDETARERGAYLFMEAVKS